MRLEDYLDRRNDNIANFADAFDQLTHATKEYDKATENEAEKDNEKTREASHRAYDDRIKATTDLVEIIERIVGVRRYVVEEDGE